jgi:hypothetical protein
MPDANAILQFCLSADMHTHRSIKSVLLAFVCGPWVVHYARVRRIYTNALPSVHSLTAG